MKTTTLLTAILMICSTGIFAQVIKVPEDQPTIQEGINAALNGDIVLVKQGIYYENINFNGKAITVMSNYLNSLDSADIYNTIIDGSQPANPDNASVVYFISGEDNASVLAGFTIRNGTGTFPTPWVDRAGGGIYCVGSGPKIIHNRIINNTVEYAAGAEGGGIFTDTTTAKTVIIKHNYIANNHVENQNANYLEAAGGGVCIGGKAMLTNNVITNNVAKGWPHGAGVYVWRGSGKIAQNVISNNHAIVNIPYGLGAGIHCTSPFPGLSIERNTISNNICTDAPGKGGGISIMQWAELGDYYITGNTILGNKAENGGGISISGLRNAIITNNVIRENEATNYSGGGVLLWGITDGVTGWIENRSANCTGIPMETEENSSMHQFINNTIAMNHAAFAGGGITCDLASGEFYAVNNIFCENTASLASDIYLLSGNFMAHLFNNNIDEEQIFGNWTGKDNISADPMFMGSGENPCCLTANSPCIDAGWQSDWHQIPPRDKIGNTRVFDGNGDGSAVIDMGAYEYIYRDVPLFPVAQLENIMSGEDLYTYPNPFTSITTIAYYLELPGNVILQLLDSNGQVTLTLVDEIQNEGYHSIMLEDKELLPGVYVCVLTTAEGIRTEKLIKL